MRLRAQLRETALPLLRRHPVLKRRLIAADKYLDAARQSVAAVFPQAIRPQPRHLTVAITAYCNLRCVGCRYGRDFMPGAQLPLPIMRDLLDDAKEAGMELVRIYGGEPLLHPDLPQMVEHSVKRGLGTYVTTNAILLAEKIDDLYAAGLRDITIGFYGVGAPYDEYVQRKERFAKLEAGIAAVRERYGMQVSMRVNWLLMRPSCSVEAVHEAVRFADKYALPIRVELIHYSLPYFSEGPERRLQFRPADRPAIETVVAELIRLKQERPDLIDISLQALGSIPDWLVKGPDMRVPCDKYQLIWVGADGTVQLCYVTFRMGNLHEQRLSTMLFTAEHKQFARDAFQLNCPNCHCDYNARILKHAPSRRHYAGQLVKLTRGAAE